MERFYHAVSTPIILRLSQYMYTAVPLLGHGIVVGDATLGFIPCALGFLS
jgi:hypothetical protein